MTIADRLKALYDNLVLAVNTANEFVEALPDCYDAVEDKGGTIPAQQTAANLPTAIASIPEATPEIEPKDVDFIDYDGTVLASYTFAEIANLTELPTTPTHEGLTFNKWTAALAEIKADPLQYCVVGALYKPADGKTHFFVRIEENGKPFAFSFSGTANIDWGDGNTETTTTSPASHTYATKGDYEIKVDTATRIAIYNDGYSRREIIEAWFAFYGNGYFLNSNAFWGCPNLEKVVIESGCYSEQNDTFQYTPSLRAICMDLNYNVALHRGVLNSGVKYLICKVSSTSAMGYDRQLIKACIGSGFDGSYNYKIGHYVVPSSVTSLSTYAFAYSLNCKDIYLRCTSVPTLAHATRSVDYLNPSCVFHVVDGLLSSYETATNWSTVTQNFTFVEDL